MQATLKQLSFKLVSIGLGLIMALFLAECGVRYYWYGTNGFSYVKLNSFKNLSFSGFLQRAENDSILWELQPNLDTLFKFEPFSTNNSGMRDREYSLEKPANTKRIVVIGDSFAMGSGVSDTKNYPALIEQMLSEEGTNVNIEVLNFGVGGYGLRNYVAVLNQKALTYDPDLVIIGFCGINDFLLPTEEHLRGELRLRPSREMFYISHFRKFLKQPSDEDNLQKIQSPIPSETEKAYMDAHFKALLKQTEPGNIPVLIAYYTLLPTPEVISFMEGFFESRGMHFVNAGKSLENMPLDKQIVHPLDAHPNAVVHQVYADNIYDYLKTHNLPGNLPDSDK